MQQSGCGMVPDRPLAEIFNKVSAVSKDSSDGINPVSSGMSFRKSLPKTCRLPISVGTVLVRLVPESHRKSSPVIKPTCVGMVPVRSVVPRPARPS